MNLIRIHNDIVNLDMLQRARIYEDRVMLYFQDGGEQRISREYIGEDFDIVREFFLNKVECYVLC